MIRVLIADDSTLTRVVLRDLLARDAEIEIVAEVGDGRSAVDQVRALRPDLVIMDVLMPVMDGLDAVSEIMADCPTPILVLSANTDPKDSRSAFSAIRLGALDVMPKPVGVGSEAFNEIAAELIRKVRSLCRIRVIHHYRPSRRKQLVAPPPSSLHPCILAIGASTGGPQAVLRLLKELPEGLPAATLIVQHIAAGFAAGFADWLNRETPHKVRLARAGDVLTPGQMLVAPNGCHMQVADRRVTLLETPPRHNCRPAVDVLFESLASDGLAGETVAVLLTGMGQDGAAGMAALHQGGALTLAQDQSSSAIFGMPKAAIERGAVNRVLTLSEMPAVIKNQFAAGQEPF